MNRVLTATAISAAILVFPAASFAALGGGNAMGLPGPNPGGPSYNGVATAAHGQYAAPIAAAPTGWGGGNAMGLPSPNPGGPSYNGVATAAHGQHAAPVAAEPTG